MSSLKDPQAKTLLFILDFAQPKGSSPYPAIPWEGIAGSPDTYFDTAIYKPPCTLKSPEQLKSEPLSIVALYQYFSSISASQPFQFRLREAVSEEYLERDNGDSDGDGNSHHSSSSPPETLVNPQVVQTIGSNLTATNQHDVLLASSASLTPPVPSAQPATSLTPPAPSAQPATSPVTTFSSQSTKTATIVSLAQPSTTITAMALPQVGETSPIAISSSHTTQAPADAPFNSGAGVIVSEGGSAGTDAPLNSDIPSIITQKKGKGNKKLSRKTAAKRGKGNVVDDTDPAPRRTSTRTTDLKRKKTDSDAEALDTQPAKKMKTTVKERWTYVIEEPQALASS